MAQAPRTFARRRRLQPLCRRPREGRSMPKVLFADNDFPDFELERKLFADAGLELASAQCKSENDVVAAARDCVAILLQYAPITERVVSSLPKLGIVSRLGAGFDTVDIYACARHG